MDKRRRPSSSWLSTHARRQAGERDQSARVIHRSTPPTPPRLACGKSFGSRSHLPSTSSNTSAEWQFSPPATIMHPATAAHAKRCLPSCMGGRGCQRAPSPSVKASHDDVGALEVGVSPPRMAKRPSLITHPRQFIRSILIAGSFVQAHARSDLPRFGGPRTSADASPIPPAQTTRPSGSRAAAAYTREVLRR